MSESESVGAKSVASLSFSNTFFSSYLFSHFVKYIPIGTQICMLIIVAKGLISS